MVTKVKVYIPDEAIPEITCMHYCDEVPVSVIAQEYEVTPDTIYGFLRGASRASATGFTKEWNKDCAVHPKRHTNGKPKAAAHIQVKPAPETLESKGATYVKAPEVPEVPILSNSPGGEPQILKVIRKNLETNEAQEEAIAALNDLMLTNAEEVEKANKRTDAADAHCDYLQDQLDELKSRMSDLERAIIHAIANPDA